MNYSSPLVVFVLLVVIWIVIAKIKGTKVSYTEKNGNTSVSSVPPQSMAESMSFSPEVQQAMQERNKIKAIKLLRMEKHMDLVDAKRIIDNAMDTRA
ncbi:MAG: hypothetical protein COU33_00435 [Candidatus Magasanikbacteria bacterium CG10_big_fil_rev_8_21_14_0_10_43_6]|uniref:Ribosomal protein L7/L12 C-terminal domain-containing protein n=1 Tax=Candidatus Magasanikbacteria bacterium CG10_big_fil_rev_8_21_14_0_10_43_6 TaxID=1974650 RepID=A0A2M6W2B6_9BACT|nr:MAG: hypothetical protein COU33_00435 [Candidatus Magasanikbacteria bacterium CG10_big_fil_rev_8_21_14_0_10_43_6]